MTPVDRRIIALALPALGSRAVEPIYVLVDTAIVGRLGTEHWRSWRSPPRSSQ